MKNGIYGKIQRKLDRINSPYLKKYSVVLKFGTLLYTKPLLYKVFCFKSKFKAKRKICILGGVHGDEREPALALIKFLKDIGGNKEFFRKFEVTIFPLINPRAFEVGTRNVSVDLNRCFFGVPEVRFFRKYTPKNCDVFIDFHGDVCSRYFYLYEVKPRGAPLLGRILINRLRGTHAIANHKNILGDKNNKGIIYNSIFPGTSEHYMAFNRAKHYLGPENPLKYKNKAKKIRLCYRVLVELKRILIEMV